MSTRSRSCPWWGARAVPRTVRHEWTLAELLPPAEPETIDVVFTEDLGGFRESWRYKGTLLGRPVFEVDREEWGRGGRKG